MNDTPPTPPAQEPSDSEISRIAGEMCDSPWQPPNAPERPPCWWHKATASVCARWQFRTVAQLRTELEAAKAHAPHPYPSETVMSATSMIVIAVVPCCGAAV